MLWRDTPANFEYFVDFLMLLIFMFLLILLMFSLCDFTNCTMFPTFLLSVFPWEFFSLHSFAVFTAFSLFWLVIFSYDTVNMVTNKCHIIDQKTSSLCCMFLRKILDIKNDKTTTPSPLQIIQYTILSYVGYCKINVYCKFFNFLSWFSPHPKCFSQQSSQFSDFSRYSPKKKNLKLIYYYLSHKERLFPLDVCPYIFQYGF